MSQVQVFKEETFTPLLPRLKERGIKEENALSEFIFAVTAIGKSHQLQKCSKASLQKAVFEAFNVGLTLNPAMKYAYLIPRYVRGGGYEAELQPSYQGLVYLASREEGIDRISAQVVHKNDKIEINLGKSEVNHSPCLIGDRGEIIGAYAIAESNGGKVVEWMSLADIHKIREKSDGYQAFVAGKIKQNPWDGWFSEMCRKSVVKRIFKYLVKGSDSMLAQAIELDNKDFKATLSQLGLIEQLIPTAEISEHQKDEILVSLEEMSSSQASDTIMFLKDNQLSAIHKEHASATEVNAAVLDKLNDPKA